MNEIWGQGQGVPELGLIEHDLEAVHALPTLRVLQARDSKRSTVNFSEQWIYSIQLNSRLIYDLSITNALYPSININR